MKVLYLEDNALDADLVRIEMEKRAPDIQLDVVGTLTEALAKVDRYHEIYGTSLETPAIGQVGLEIPRYDLVLTDLNLPDGSGETLLALVRGRHLPLPVVILTGSSCEDMVLALLRAGADDYVIKRDGFLETLALVLRAALDKFHTETYRRAASLRILYVEPNADDIDLTKQALASIAPHLKIESLQSAEQVFDGFAMREAKDAFDVLLLDYRLPGVSATDILKELCLVRGLDLPIILVAGQDDEEIARQSLKLGAADYV